MADENNLQVTSTSSEDSEMRKESCPPENYDTNCDHGEEEDESTPECFFNNLPDELINYIFSYFKYFERIRLERVCKRWQHVNTNISWIDMHSLKFQDKFNIKNKNILTTDILISILKRCGTTLRDINFDSCFQDSSLQDFPTHISTYCPNLESVNLSNTAVSSDSLKNLVVACENLQTLILCDTYGLCDDSLEKVLKEGKKIKYLDISQNYTVTGKCFNLVNDNVETLILNECWKLNDHNFLQLQNKLIKCLSFSECSCVRIETLTEVVKSLKPTLTELNLKNSTWNRKNMPVAIRKVLEHCENLQCLSLDKSLVNDNSIRFISSKCLQLRCINISGGKLLDDSIRTLKKLPHLREMCLSYSQTVIRLNLKTAENSNYSTSARINLN